MNERLTANEVNARRWPHGVVVRDDLGRLGMHDGGHWYGRSYDTDVLALSAEPYTVVLPAPEPDHSMCARLRPNLPSGDPAYGWILVQPDGDMVPDHIYTDEQARAARFAVPESEPSVQERVAHRLAVQAGEGHVKPTPQRFIRDAKALAIDGLLVRDGEQA